MCHCFASVDDLTAEERAAVRDEHSLDELRAAYSETELDELGVAV
ncbi:hypothetical protein [Natrialba aegyptia]|uniref:Uncharacterized protein n=1 Tax=Natrialba aegyptia DSM 13077 TaxID=1227491 RepID=M0B866_9EURY|nr:hypothetical protein [Natrialba aegyptia]ELZ06702.1 hypothetical protein C480_09028 [Natrialba aegyptia DSM 13077]